jgi:EmrB/QacA subfamily drug resistance transporter
MGFSFFRNFQESGMKIGESEHYRRILFCACFTIFAWRLDTYTVTISLPTISRHFDVATNTVALVVICYSLLISSSLLVVGKIEDIYGIRRLLVWGFLIFALGGVGAALSPSITFLILARSVQGVAGAILISSVYAIVCELLPEGKRGRAFGLVSASAGLGVAVGAPLGGMISGLLSWRGVFLLDVCLGLVGAAVVLKTVPSTEKKEKDVRSKFDISGAVLSFLAVFLMLFALNRASRLGWGSPVIPGCLLASVIFGVLFVFKEKRSVAPLVDLRLFGDYRPYYGLIVGVLMFAAMSGNAILMPFYLEMIQGMTPQLAGSIFLAYSLTRVVTSPFAGRIADGVPPRFLVTAALLIGAGAFFFFGFIVRVPGNRYFIVFLILWGLSVGSYLPANNHVVMRHAPENKRGAFSSLYNVFNNLGWAIGACLSESVFSHYISCGMLGVTHRGASPKLLIEGFHYTYVLGGVLLLVALIPSAILLRFSWNWTRASLR